VAALAYARSEAVKRGRPVTVCASSNGSDCNSSQWEKGWIVFTDDTGTAGKRDGSDQVLKVFGRVSGGVDIDLGGVSFVRFLPTGALDS